MATKPIKLKSDTVMPVYGCFLQGKNWVFATLQGKNYCVSSQFDATQKEDLLQIISALKHLKTLILK